MYFFVVKGMSSLFFALVYERDADSISIPNPHNPLRPSISNKENCGSTAEVTTDVTRPGPRGVKDDFSALQKDNHHQHHLSRMEADIQRMRRTIRLLISIGCIFCFSWLPLNILNIVSPPHLAKTVTHFAQILAYFFLPKWLVLRGTYF